MRKERDLEMDITAGIVESKLEAGSNRATTRLLATIPSWTDSVLNSGQGEISGDGIHSRYC